MSNDERYDIYSTLKLDPKMLLEQMEFPPQMQQLIQNEPEQIRKFNHLRSFIVALNQRLTAITITQIENDFDCVWGELLQDINLTLETLKFDRAALNAEIDLYKTLDSSLKTLEIALNDSSGGNIPSLLVSIPPQFELPTRNDNDSQNDDDYDDRSDNDYYDDSTALSHHNSSWDGRNLSAKRIHDQEYMTKFLKDGNKYKTILALKIYTVTTLPAIVIPQFITNYFLQMAFKGSKIITNHSDHHKRMKKMDKRYMDKIFNYLLLQRKVENMFHIEEYRKQQEVADYMNGVLPPDNNVGSSTRKMTVAAAENGDYYYHYISDDYCLRLTNYAIKKVGFSILDIFGLSSIPPCIYNHVIDTSPSDTVYAYLLFLDNKPEWTLEDWCRCYKHTPLPIESNQATEDEAVFQLMQEDVKSGAQFFSSIPFASSMGMRKQTLTISDISRSRQGSIVTQPSRLRTNTITQYASQQQQQQQQQTHLQSPSGTVARNVSFNTIGPFQPSQRPTIIKEQEVDQSTAFTRVRGSTAMREHHSPSLSITNRRLDSIRGTPEDYLAAAESVSMMDPEGGHFDKSLQSHNNTTDSSDDDGPEISQSRTSIFGTHSTTHTTQLHDYAMQKYFHRYLALRDKYTDAMTLYDTQKQETLDYLEDYPHDNYFVGFFEQESDCIVDKINVHINGLALYDESLVPKKKSYRLQCTVMLGKSYSLATNAFKSQGQSNIPVGETLEFNNISLLRQKLSTHHSFGTNLSLYVCFQLFTGHLMNLTSAFTTRCIGLGEWHHHILSDTTFDELLQPVVDLRNHNNEIIGEVHCNVTFLGKWLHRHLRYIRHMNRISSGQNSTTFDGIKQDYDDNVNKPTQSAEEEKDYSDFVDAMQDVTIRQIRQSIATRPEFLNNNGSTNTPVSLSGTMKELLQNQILPPAIEEEENLKESLNEFNPRPEKNAPEEKNQEDVSLENPAVIDLPETQTITTTALSPRQSNQQQNKNHGEKLELPELVPNPQQVPAKIASLPLSRPRQHTLVTSTIPSQTANIPRQPNVSLSKSSSSATLTNHKPLSTPQKVSQLSLATPQPELSIPLQPTFDILNDDESTKRNVVCDPNSSYETLIQISGLKLSVALLNASQQLPPFTSESFLIYELNECLKMSSGQSQYKRGINALNVESRIQMLEERLQRLTNSVENGELLLSEYVELLEKQSTLDKALSIRILSFAKFLKHFGNVPKAKHWFGFGIWVHKRFEITLHEYNEVVATLNSSANTNLDTLGSVTE